MAASPCARRWPAPSPTARSIRARKCAPTPAPLFVISDLRRLWLLVDVPESALASVRQGQAVSVETDAYPGRRFSATVAHVAPVLDPQTRRIQVRCTLDNADGALKPEMFARAAYGRRRQHAGRGPAEYQPVRRRRGWLCLRGKTARHV
jgi:multidrug efflux pump subunit AcrA (membrane-fusion protein)